MPRLRSYLHPTTVPPTEIIQLDTQESHHLVRVSRGRQGDGVSVFDGQGNEWQCLITEPNPRGALLKIQKHSQIRRPFSGVVLAQALPKGKTMDEIVRKATEIGVTRIVPLETCETKAHPKQNRNKVDKWTSVAVQACKQSGNSFLPEITPIQHLESWLLNHRRNKGSLSLVASLESNTVSLQAAFEQFCSHNKDLPREIICLIGPEGDFTPEEYSLIKDQGLHPIRLSANILRVATAATYALSIIDYELFLRQDRKRSNSLLKK